MLAASLATPSILQLLYDAMLRHMLNERQVRKAVNERETCGWGQTALHFAAIRGHDAMVQVILSHGGDPLRTNRTKVLSLD